MKKPFEVKEFDIIVSDSNSTGNPRFQYLDHASFLELFKFAKEYSTEQNQADALDFMKIGYRRNVGDIISIRNYVGLIQLQSGFQLQILPKIPFISDNDPGSINTKRIFLKMLRTMKDFPCKVFTDASLDVAKMNLYELFINMYLQQVRLLTKHGLRSAYQERSENLFCYKGKLCVKQQLQHNLVHRERFYVQYDEFSVNRAENRLVKSTLLKLQKLTSSVRNAKEIKQLLLAFDGVDVSLNYAKDFSMVNLTRDCSDYNMLIQWAKIFLYEKAFTTFSGSANSRALLFPMESVYESYVTYWVRRIMSRAGWSVSSQEHRYHLFTEPKRLFALRPDIVLRRGNRTVILDTKWKNLSDNISSNYGISQGDMYQMFAYSRKYNTPEVWLLYPLTPHMLKHAPIYFSSDDPLKLSVHFIDLANIEDSVNALRAQLSISSTIS